MGRVYKALAKSWKEQSGSEPKEVAKTPPRPEARTVRREERREEFQRDSRDDIVYGLGMVQQERIVVFTNHPMPATFKVEDELPILRDAAAARESQVNDWVYAQ